MDAILDVFIIGAGPIGLCCGIEAKKENFTYQIVDKGCLVNSLYNYPLNMTFFSSSEKLEIGDVPFVSHLNKPNRGEALEYYRRLTQKWDLNVNLYETVNSVSSLSNSLYKVVTDKKEYFTKAIIVATGFYDLPTLMNVEGENLSKVFHYYKEPHPFIGQKVAVIGASNSSVDVALETYRKGADVTLIVRDSKIKQSVKYWVLPDIENRIKEGEIKAIFNATVQKITDKSILINTLNGVVELENDYVLAMTGYQPNFSFLKLLGIKINTDDEKIPFYNPLTMETNQLNIYLAGVICGGLQTRKWFIENSREHAPLIINDLKRKLKN